MLTHATNSGKSWKDSPTNKPQGVALETRKIAWILLKYMLKKMKKDKQNQHGGGYHQESMPKVAYEMTSKAKASVNADAEFITNMENIRNGSKYHANQVGTGSELVSDMSKSTAKVWVVRYVDYTSKYGLGFLLNTGSAGVYFNDSTKIVLSADGTIFQYIERKNEILQAPAVAQVSISHRLTLCQPTRKSYRRKSPCFATSVTIWWINKEPMGRIQRRRWIGCCCIKQQCCVEFTDFAT